MIRASALLAVAALIGVGVVAATPPATSPSGSASTPPAEDGAIAIAAGKLPAGFRDWRLISVAHEEGDLHSFAAVLGNDVAIKAYRDGTLPFPDGTIIAALHYRHVPSEENNKVFGRDQSFVPGPPTNVQFMVKDSTRYAATGGWKFAHFTDGKPLTDPAKLQSCFDCHAMHPEGDLVFAHYAP